jgi:hypothetical protein
MMDTTGYGMFVSLWLVLVCEGGKLRVLPGPGGHCPQLKAGRNKDVGIVGVICPLRFSASERKGCR